MSKKRKKSSRKTVEERTPKKGTVEEAIRKIRDASNKDQKPEWGDQDG